MWRQVGLNVPIEMKRELAADLREQRPARACATGRTARGFNDPISSIVGQHGPQGQQQQVGEWTNEEMNKLSAALEVETDMQKRKAMFKRMLEICEREDPAYTVLHQNATFTAKRKDIRWKASPSFAMDFRAVNFRHQLRSAMTRSRWSRSRGLTVDFDERRRVRRALARRRPRDRAAARRWASWANRARARA